MNNKNNKLSPYAKRLLNRTRDRIINVVQQQSQSNESVDVSQLDIESSGADIVNIPDFNVETDVDMDTD